MKAMRWSSFSGAVISCEVAEGSAGRKHKLWIRNANSGLERYEEFSAQSVSAREGHEVRVHVLLLDDGGDVVSHIENRTTGRVLQVRDADTLSRYLMSEGTRDRLFWATLARMAGSGLLLSGGFLWFGSALSVGTTCFALSVACLIGSVLLGRAPVREMTLLKKQIQGERREAGSLTAAV